MGRRWAFGPLAIATVFTLRAAVGCGLQAKGQAALDDASVADAEAQEVGSPDTSLLDAGTADGDASVDRDTSSGCDDASTGTDPLNCGSCGHDCLGGACVAGTCQPVALAAGLDGPQGLALDGAGNLYFTESSGGRIGSCPVNNCTTPAVLATNQISPNWIALWNGVAYWTNFDGQTVGFCSLPACTDFAVLSQVAGGEQLVRVAAGEAGVFFTDQTDNTVFTCPLKDCTGGPFVYDNNNRHAPFGIAVDATSVYWADYLGGTVQQCALQGCATASVTLATNQDYPKNLVIDSTTVYWADNASTGSVRSCAIGGCGGQPTTLAGQFNYPDGIAVDDSWLYVVATGDGRIVRVPKGGGTTVVLATDANNPWNIVTDKRAIYWTDDMAAPGGQIMRLAK